jgi:asparaginyl-tRNA synthetase
MIKRSKVVDLLIHATGSTERVLVKGWVRTRRDSKELCFIELNDGSCLKNLQIIVEADLLSNYQAIKVLGVAPHLTVVASNQPVSC